MTTVKILGIGGSPRKGANTTMLVRAALEAAAEAGGVETELYECAGKRFRPCVDCGRCLETGFCAIKDDVAELAAAYEEADGVIWGAPVYVMSIPATLKAAIDRLSNSKASHYLREAISPPRDSKVCGVLTVGAHRNGGEELTLAYLLSTCLMNANVVVSGDTLPGAYIGASCWSGAGDVIPGRDTVAGDEIGLECVRSLGQRVAEMTKIVVAGREAVRAELPEEYFAEHVVTLTPRTAEEPS